MKNKDNKELKDNYPKKRLGMIMFLAIVIVLIFAIGFGCILLMQSKVIKNSSERKTSEYSRHFAMITKDFSSEFWKDVCKNAKAYAEDKGIILEEIGENLSDDYTLSDFLKISIASGVDGIIIEPDGSEKVNDLINKADSLGIPVVTVVNDASDTNRVSFVGINTYQMGQVYAKEIEKLLDKRTRNVYVLIEKNTARNDVIFGQIKSTLLQGIGSKINIDIEPYYLENKNAFDVEEGIRNLFLNKRQIPNIVVSLSETASECACQAVIDYNKVGRIKLVNYYSASSTLKAIKKGIVSKSIELDARQIGENSIQVLNDYIDSGHVSDYISVDMNVISKNNIADYEGGKIVENN